MVINRCKTTLVISALASLIVISLLYQGQGVIWERTEPNHGEQVDGAYQGGRSMLLPNANRMKSFTPSEDPVSGYIDPVDVKHSRYEDSETVRAGTNSGTSNKMNVTLDEENGWFASQTKVEVTDVRNLYALNGTFDDGVDPWVSSMYNPNSQVGSATYNSTDQFVTVSNTGAYDATPRPNYVHYQDTYVYWTQTITNSPLATNFSLTYDFLYASGPMDGPVQDIWNDANLVVYIDSTEVTNPIQLYREVSDRNTWYSVSESIYIPSSPASFVLKIGLFYDDTAGYEVGEDYDNDGQADDLEDLQKVEIWLDNIEFKGIDSPDFEQVDMRFHAGTLESPITGTTSVGSAVIKNPSFWTSNPLQVEITANSSVIFNYKVTTLLHQYTNSSWSPSPLRSGVSYSVAPGQSAELKLYTYVPVTYLNLNVTIDIEHPLDWANGTVYDSLLTDVTIACNVSQGLITIPANLMDSVGWWEIRLESPNYAKNLAVQIYDSETEQWLDNTLFKSGNKTRVNVQLGTPTSTPVQGSPVNISWIMPNSTVWMEEHIETMVDGDLNGTPLTLGGQNTTVGQWDLNIIWTNGTEIALGTTSFEVHHSARIDVIDSLIETAHGLTITSRIQYIDDDTNKVIMDPSTSIVANWSGSSIIYEPNYLRGWWEVDIDTGLMTAGQFVVTINSTHNHFNNFSTSFELTSIYSDSTLTVLNGDSINMRLIDSHLCNFTYNLTNGTGIEGATFDITYSGPSSGLHWSSVVPLGVGNYEVEFSVTSSGTYVVYINASKPFHESATDSIVIVVGAIDSLLILRNGTSDVISYGETYRVVMSYTDGNLTGLLGADVGIWNVNPSTGLSIGTTVDHGDGNYSIILTPTDANIYSITFRANLTNYEPSYVTFLLSVSKISTILTINETSPVVSISRNYTIWLNFTTAEYVGIDGASITLENPPASLIYYETEDHGSGNYSITVYPTVSDTFLLVFIASTPNHIDASAALSLIVREIPTTVNLDQTSATIDFGQTWTMVVTYSDENGTGLISADLEVVSVAPLTGLTVEDTIDEANGNYSILLIPNKVDIYTLTIRANLSNYETKFLTFVLTVSEIPSILTIPESSAIASLFRNYTVWFNFTDIAFNGLENASVILDNTPIGVIAFDAVDHGLGNYSMNINPTLSGTYLLVFRASIANYLDASTSLSFIVQVIPTGFEVDSPSGLINYGQEFTVRVSYLDDIGAGLGGADVNVVDISPAIGLSIDDITDLGNGSYTITIVNTAIGTYTLSIRANLTNYEINYLTYVLTVAENPSILESLETTSIAGIRRNYTIWLNFTDSDLNGIDGANLTLEDPEPGLIYYDALDHGSGNYSIVVRSMTFGTFLLIFRASAPNYLDATTAISFIVRAIPTDLRINATSALVNFGQSCSLILTYRDVNGTGLAGADVGVVSISPSNGLVVGETVDLENGSYSIILAHTQATIFTITLTANLSIYETKYVTFVMTVTEIPSKLSTPLDSVVLTVAQNYTVWLHFTDANSNPLAGAELLVENPPSTIYYSDFIEHGPGNYSISLSGTSSGTYLLVFQASVANHQDATTAISLIIQAVPTVLTIDGETSISTDFLNSVTVHLLYQRTDLNTNVSFALLNVSASDLTGLTISISSYQEYYLLHILSNRIGRWVLSITASKDNHYAASIQVILDVNPIETQFEGTGPSNTLYINRESTYSFRYSMVENETSITDADFLAFGNGAEFVALSESESGNYSLDIMPTELGRYVVYLSISKYGYVEGSLTLIFETKLIPISIDDNPIDFFEGFSVLTIGLNLTETHSGSPISGADLDYVLYQGESIIQEGVLYESSSTPGYYIGQIEELWSSQYLYTFSITIEADDYESVSNFTQSFTPRFDIMTATLGILTYYGPYGLLLIISIGSVAAMKRIYSKRRRTQYNRALEMRRRVNDADNLLGLMLIHKNSGLPIYSRAITRHIEDGLISAFISAITHFRSEITFTGEGEIGKVMPMSDIVHVVPTRSLLVAIITMGMPSMEQNIKISEYGKALALMFDDAISVAPNMNPDEETMVMIDQLFEEYLDAQLGMLYMRKSMAPFPRKLQLVEEAIDSLDMEHGFKLRSMLNALIYLGTTETDAYLLLQEVLAENLLTKVELEDVRLTETEFDE